MQTIRISSENLRHLLKGIRYLPHYFCTTLNITCYNHPGTISGRNADSYFENINGVRRDSPTFIGTLLVQMGHDIYTCDLPQFFNPMFSQLFQIIALALGYQIQYDEYTTQVM